MFHVKHPEAIDRFLDAARAVGLSPSDEQATLLMVAAERLSVIAAGSGISGYEHPDTVLDRGMAPALPYFAFPELPADGSLADLGAGTGALGATIAILAKNLHVDLADRAQRAYTACEMLVRRLALPNLRAVLLDAADGTRQRRYDAVVLRAVAPAVDALALAAGITRPGGFIAALHRADDRGFRIVQVPLELIGSRETAVSGLVMSAYRRQS